MGVVVVSELINYNNEHHIESKNQFFLIEYHYEKKLIILGNRRCNIIQYNIQRMSKYTYEAYRELLNSALLNHTQDNIVGNIIGINIKSNIQADAIDISIITNNGTNYCHCYCYKNISADVASEMAILNYLSKLDTIEFLSLEGSFPLDFEMYFKKLGENFLQVFNAMVTQPNLNFLHIDCVENQKSDYVEYLKVLSKINDLDTLEIVYNIDLDIQNQSNHIGYFPKNIGTLMISNRYNGKNENVFSQLISEMNIISVKQVKINWKIADGRIIDNVFLNFDIANRSVGALAITIEIVLTETRTYYPFRQCGCNKKKYDEFIIHDSYLWIIPEFPNAINFYKKLSLCRSLESFNLDFRYCIYRNNCIEYIMPCDFGLQAVDIIIKGIGKIFANNKKLVNFNIGIWIEDNTMRNITEKNQHNVMIKEKVLKKK